MDWLLLHTEMDSPLASTSVSNEAGDATIPASERYRPLTDHLGDCSTIDTHEYIPDMGRRSLFTTETGLTIRILNDAELLPELEASPLEPVLVNHAFADVKERHFRRLD